MNRKERRAQRLEVPPGYVEATKRLVMIVRAFVQSGVEPPRFAMPPRAVLLIAGLDQIGARFARNDPARTLLELALAGVELKEMPTPNMLRVALEANGVHIEECALADLGDDLSVLSRGGAA